VGARGATLDEAHENLIRDFQQAARRERDGKSCEAGPLSPAVTPTFLFRRIAWTAARPSTVPEYPSRGKSSGLGNR
jgi:hypothetical protein